MSESTSAPNNPPADSPTSVSVFRAKRVFVMSAVLLVLAGIFGWYQLSKPNPPLPDLEGADPDVAQTIHDAREAVTLSRGTAESWANLGVLFHVHGYPDEACECFEQATAKDSNDLHSRYLWAVSLSRESPDAARPHLQRAVELLDDQDDAPLVRLAELEFELDQFAEAETLFRRLLDRNPRHPRGHLGLARVLSRRDDATAALSHLEAVADSKYAQRSAHILMSEIHQRAGNHEEAKQAMAHAETLPLDFKWPDPILDAAFEQQVGRVNSQRRANELREQGFAAKGQAMFHRTEERHHDFYWEVEGRMLLKQGKVREAEVAFAKALEIRPDSLDPLKLHGACLLRLGKLAKAESALRKALQIEPGSSEAHRLLGECLERHKRPNEAIESYRRAVARMPFSAVAHEKLGQCLIANGRSAEGQCHLGGAHAIK